MISNDFNISQDEKSLFENYRSIKNKENKSSSEFSILNQQEKETSIFQVQPFHKLGYNLFGSEETNSYLYEEESSFLFRSEQKTSNGDIQFQTENFLNKKNDIIQDNKPTEKPENNILKEKFIKKENIIIELPKDPKEIREIKNENSLKKKRGRKESKSKEKNKIHSRNSSDNIVTKIKRIVINECLIPWLNNNFLYRNNNCCDKFYKLETKGCISNNKKDFIMPLFDKSLRQFLSEVNNTTKNKKSGGPNINHNKELIHKIFDEGKEIKVIYILNLTFSKLLELFINKNNYPQKGIKLTDNIIYNWKYTLDCFKEKNKNEDIHYLKKLEDLAVNLRDYFDKKIGRTNSKEFK